MKGNVPPAFELVAPGVPALVRALIRTQNEQAINDITWGLSFFTQNGTVESLQCLIQAGAVPRLTQLIEHSSMQIAVPALRTVGNILSANEEMA